MSDQPMTEITQADREAADEWRLDMDPGMRSLLAAAFARHREAAAAEERAKIVAYLRREFGFDSVAADFIEAKEHLQ